MSSKGNKGGSPNYFVSQTNPEIFEASPRPGGVARIELPPKPSRLKEAHERRKSATEISRGRSRSRASNISRSKSKIPSRNVPSDTASITPSRKSLLTLATVYGEVKNLDIDTCPRAYKVKKIIGATPWSVEFDEYLQPSEESKRIPDPFQDSVDMLAMCISVIMLLARGYSEIKESQYRWVLSYLQCIRDEFGQVPPNVQGVLNHINMVSGGTLKSYLDEDFEPPELQDKTVRISTVPVKLG